MPPLTPDTKRFKAIGLLKQSQLKSVSLVEEIGTEKRFVAHQLKTPSTLSKEQAATRLAGEAAALEGVSYPNLPHFEGYLSTATGNWFLFEYLDGYPLSQHKGDNDKVPNTWVLWWFNQMLTTLHELHTKKVVIGGFEPKHFLVHDDTLYLVHVGILENLFPETLALLRSPERLTFTAPEHRHSIQTSVTGDLYSAGAVAYWLATGKAPAYGSHVPEDQVLSAIRGVRPDFPVEVASIITRLIQFQHQKRFESASEPLGILKPFVPELKGSAPPAPVRPYKVRFFGRETSARLTTEAVEAEKKAGPSIADAVAAAIEQKTDGPLSQKTMRPAGAPVRPRGPLESDTDKLNKAAASALAEAPASEAAPAVSTASPPAPASATSVSKDPVAAEEKPAGPTPFQEFVEDIVWSTFRKSPVVTSLVLIGVVLVGILCVWAMGGVGNGPKAATADTLSLVAGTISQKVGSQSEWTTTQTVSTPDCTVVATQHNSPTVLRFGHGSTLHMDEHTAFRFVELANSTLKITLKEGHATIEPATGDTAEIGVGVNTVVCPGDSVAEFTVGESESGETHEPQVKCKQGSINIKTMSGATNLISGNSYTLSDVPAASATPSPTSFQQ